jgi:hypothetical protein
LAHTIGSRQISLRSALYKPLDNFLTLMDGKHRRPAKTHPTGFSAGSTLTGAGTDQLPLKFRDTGQHGHEQPTMWRCGVGPAIGQRLEANTPLAKRTQAGDFVAAVRSPSSGRVRP